MIPTDCFAIPGITLHYNDTNGLLRTSCSRNPGIALHYNDTNGLLRTSCSCNPGIALHDNDTNGLLRTSCSRNPTKYSHIVGLASHFYAHILAGPKFLYTRMSKLMRV